MLLGVREISRYCSLDSRNFTAPMESVHTAHILASYSTLSPVYPGPDAAGHLSTYLTQNMEIVSLQSMILIWIDAPDYSGGWCRRIRSWHMDCNYGFSMN